MSDNRALAYSGIRADTVVRGHALTCGHVLQFYADDGFLAQRVVAFVSEGLLAGELVSVIATEAHARAYRALLEARGVDLAGACASGSLTLLDADELLSRFMRNGAPELELFERELAAEVARKATGARSFRAYGEMVDLLWQRGQRDAALRLEALWNELHARHPFTLLCAYALGSFQQEPAELQRVCGIHTHVMTDVSGANDGQADAFATELPPQHARRLAQEVSQRQKIETALSVTAQELRVQEDALRQSEEQLRDFVENATIGLHRLGYDGTILWANRAELSLLGYEADEYVGQPVANFHVDRVVVEDILARLRQKETLRDYEARLRAKDGSVKHVLISSNVYAPNGEFAHTRCFVRDITERRRTEDLLVQSQRQLRAVTDALPALVSYVDSDLRYRFVNAAYESWFGRAKEQILGKLVRDVVGEHAYRAIQPHVERALAGIKTSSEHELPLPDGRTRLVEATCVPQFAIDGNVRGFVTLVNDVTERKSFERFRSLARARTLRLVELTAALASASSDTELGAELVGAIHTTLLPLRTALALPGDDGTGLRHARALGRDDVARRPIRPISVPLAVDGRTLGALELTLDQDRKLDADEQAFIALAARYASLALERLRLTRGV